MSQEGSSIFALRDADSKASFYAGNAYLLCIVSLLCLTSYPLCGDMYKDCVPSFSVATT